MRDYYEDASLGNNYEQILLLGAYVTTKHQTCYCIPLTMVPKSLSRCKAVDVKR